MFRRFSFEQEMYEALECIPLAVRRKLDLVGIKLPLNGWQAMTSAERIALCHLPVDTEEELYAYRGVLVGFCVRAGAKISVLTGDDTSPETWSAQRIPKRVADRVEALGFSLSLDQWSALDEECRYALYKHANPKKAPTKMHALLVELGLAPGPAPVIQPQRVVCPAPLTH